MFSSCNGISEDSATAYMPVSCIDPSLTEKARISVHSSLPFTRAKLFPRGASIFLALFFRRCEYRRGKNRGKPGRCIGGQRPATRVSWPRRLTSRLDLAPEPRLRGSQIAPHNVNRHFQTSRDLVRGHPTEESHLHQQCFFWVRSTKRAQSVIERGDYVRRFMARSCLRRYRGLGPDAPFGRLPDADMIDENVTHHPRRHAEKVRPAANSGCAGFDQAQVCFVNEGSRLQSVVPRFAAKVCLRDSMQLGVDRRDETVERLAVPFVAASNAHAILLHTTCGNVRKNSNEIHPIKRRSRTQSTRPTSLWSRTTSREAFLPANRLRSTSNKMA